MAQSNKRYRVALMGTGPLGQFLAREIHRSPEMELIGALVYSDSKDNVDVGEIVGIGPIGVKATKNFDEFLKLPADCVVHTVRDYGDFRTDEDIIKLLEAGKNVVSSLPYFYLKARGADVESRFRASAERGGVTLHGSALNPNYLWERLGMTLTGLCVDVTSMSLKEYFNMEKVPEEACRILGFGLPKEEAEKNLAMAFWVENYAKQALGYVTDQLGVKVDRIERSSRFDIAPEKITGPMMTIEKGMVGIVSHGWTVYSEDKPFMSTQHNWYLTEAMRPAVADGDNFWTFDIKGRPELQVSIKSISYEDTPAGYLMTAAPILKSIPKVIAAPPGLLLPSMPKLHWKPSH